MMYVFLAINDVPISNVYTESVTLCDVKRCEHFGYTQLSEIKS